MGMIKKYFLSWDFARIIKLVFGVLMVIGYFSTKENIYLFGAVFFIVQAAFNIGCPGGSCATNVPKKSEKPVMKFEKYEPNKAKRDV
jgi:hypothetical protein